MLEITLSHKADRSFFDEKKVWSEKKDQILSNYLTPYLAKVKKLRKPILIVDAFAGKGKFDDGKPGSPLIICEKAKLLYKSGVDIQVVCIEQNEKLYVSLRQDLEQYDFAKAVHGSFLDFSNRIASSAARKTVFLFVDPYDVHSLEWQALIGAARHIHTSNSSVELLLNFQALTFVRSGWSALKRKPKSSDPTTEDIEEYEKKTIESSSIVNMNKIAGGTWWQDVLSSTAGHEEQIDQIMQELQKKLAQHFEHTCYVPIKLSDNKIALKYFMVYGTRHAIGLHLMNDEMVKSRDETEFDTNMFAKSELENIVLDEMPDKIKRGDLITKVLHRKFCVYETKDIRKTIANLKGTKIRFPSGKSRISDRDVIERM